MDARLIADQQIDPDTPLYKVRSFRLLFVTRVASSTAFQMVSVIVGWHVYEITDSALHLGLIGLAQFVPQFFLMLPAGQIADRLNRRTVLWWCYGLAFLSAAGLMLVAAQERPSLLLLYLLVGLNMAARTFEQPVMQALLPVMAPRAVLNRAIAAHISARQTAVLVGPLLGGALYYFGPVFDYGVCAALTLAAAVSAFLLPNPGRPDKPMALSWDSVVVGFRFIWRRETILGAMLLEFLSSLFGSVQALLPIYARDILEVGAWGAGVLRSATAFGGLLAAAVLTRMPIKSAGGYWLFGSFTLQGLAVIAFGFSTDLALSIVALIVVGIGDLIATVIRQTLIQMQTPDAMRGRVFSVNSLFYGTSSQIGQFRAGITAEWFGAVAAVALGGAALLGGVALWGWRFPGLRNVGNPALVGQADATGDQDQERRTR
ncbi:MAG: MFS transporter [Hyphomicrobiales bacterium]|nr:MFS transporter [Hyphomicrobiales bacterium]